MRAVGNEKLECVAVTVRAKAADHRLRHVAEIGMFAEWLACMRVRQMHLDKWGLYRCKGIAQGNAGMGESGWVDQDEAGSVIPCGLDAIDQLVFGIGLEGLQLVPDLCGALAKAGIDLFERRTAIDSRLAFTEQIQIRTV